MASAPSAARIRLARLRLAPATGTASSGSGSRAKVAPASSKGTAGSSARVGGGGSSGPWGVPGAGAAGRTVPRVLAPERTPVAGSRRGAGVVGDVCAGAEACAGADVVDERGAVVVVADVPAGADVVDERDVVVVVVVCGGSEGNVGRGGGCSWPAAGSAIITPRTTADVATTRRAAVRRSWRRAALMAGSGSRCCGRRRPTRPHRGRGRCLAGSRSSGSRRRRR